MFQRSEVKIESLDLKDHQEHIQSGISCFGKHVDTFKHMRGRGHNRVKKRKDDAVYLDVFSKAVGIFMR